MKPRPKLVALVGGSGAGKTWLSDRLQEALALPVTRLSLDDFYRDQSHVEPSRRDRLNFDHPRAIDWELAETALRTCRTGGDVRIPCYCFVTHTRKAEFKLMKPQPVILVDGLWLLWKPMLRPLFDVRVFLHCPEQLRLERRLTRDKEARGRDDHSVRRQFQETVAPMHERFVAPQVRWADVVLSPPVGQNEVKYLADTIENMTLSHPDTHPTKNADSI